MTNELHIRCTEVDERTGSRWSYTVVGCKHDKVKGLSRYDYTVDATNPVHGIECEVNEDFAGDEGISVEEYLANGNGYTVASGDIKVCPCLKGTAKDKPGTTSDDRRAPMRSGPTRDQMLARLRRYDYTGPTSFTKQDLYTKVYVPFFTAMGEEV